jgi:programmed cell death 8 (apoptosis-inducing factor)
MTNHNMPPEEQRDVKRKIGIGIASIIGIGAAYAYLSGSNSKSEKRREAQLEAALREEAQKTKKQLEEMSEKLAEANEKLESERAQVEAERKLAAEDHTKRKEERKERRAKRKEERRQRKAAKAEAKQAAATQDSVEAPNASPEAHEASPEPATARDDDDEEEAPIFPAKYVIVGGGPTAFNAMKEILHLEPEAQILIISEEENTPYDRSPLSKELFWQKDFEATEQLKYPDWRGNLYDLEYHPSGFYSDPSKNLTFMKGRKVTDLDAGRHLITMDDGTQFKYEKCLLAVGTTPRSLSDVGVPAKLESPEALAHVSTVKTVPDFLALHKATLDPSVKHVTVIGNDYVAADLVDALVIRARVTGSGTKVAQVFPDSGVLASIFPVYFAEYLTKKTQATGVDVRPSVQIMNIEEQGEGAEHRLKITLNDDRVIDTDHIVLSLGGVPNVDLAKRAYLELDELSGGIAVNAELEARTDLYVAGDVASFYDGHLGRRRVEGIDHAEISGKVAGLNMTGKNKAYTYQPIHWGAVSQNMSYQSVGLVDSRLDMVGVWQKGPNAPLIPSEQEFGLVPDPNAPLSSEYEDASAYERGVVYYMNGSKVVGVTMINVNGQMEAAKRLVTFPRQFEDLSRLRTQIYLGNKPKTEDEPISAPL